MIYSMNNYEYKGGCHCGQVRYSFQLSQPIEDTEILACNCSICEKTGYIHLIIPKSEFELLTDWNNIENYQFNKKIANHYFCKKCGIKSFYQPRSHPDQWSINARCLDEFSNLPLKVKGFDGKNWEANIESIAD